MKPGRSTKSRRARHNLQVLSSVGFEGHRNIQTEPRTGKGNTLMLTHFVQAKTFPNNKDVLKMTFLFLMAACELMHTTTTCSSHT